MIKVLRGGSWMLLDYYVEYMLCIQRGSLDAHKTTYDGFRIVIKR